MCLAHHLVRPVIALLLLTVSLLLRTSLNFVYADGVSAAPNDWTTERKYIARDKVRDLFYHGYNSYLQYAWPLDELAPLSCAGRGPDWHKPENIAVNDVNGNFSLTLIDTLDTLVVFGDPVAFEDAVQRVISHVSFNVDTKPQIFEANIRVLGGLLSGHIFASKKGHPFYLPWYDGELLELAHDLGKRFLPAFSTPTGIPYARINLRHGVPKGESLESCAAGAGSLILEFATLSRLTGDARFEKVARKAFFAIWNARSDIGLVGNQINLWTGAWQFPLMSSIGAGIDSFFEYALKWYVLSGDPEFLDVWNESYASVMRYSRSQDGLWFRRVDLNTGNLMYYTLDSLSAFWPGLQVLAGDIENAIKSHMLFWNLWQRYSGLPEVWDMSYKTATSMAFPLRPEFVESTWYLYRATRDPFYLDVGERILNDLTSRSRVMCGLTGIADLRTNQRDDRMESFVLSETLKYLYLLFDEENPLHADDSNWVFTTEGHILSLDIPRQTKPSKVVRELRRHEAPQCPSYMPPEFGSDQWHAPGLEVGVRSRPDWDYATHLVGGPQFNDTRAAAYWHAEGICTTPEVDMYTFEFIMSIGGEQVVEDMSPGKSKLAFVPDGFVVHGVAGIRTRVTTRLDGRGYDITKLGPYTVRTGQIVYVKDTELLKTIRASGPPDDAVRERSADVSALFFIDFKNDKKVAAAAALGGQTQIAVSAQTALFGGDPGAPRAHEILPAAAPEGVAVVRDRANPFGCDEYAAGAFGHSGARDAAVFLVRRGECTFLEKLQRAREAGAAGVIVVSHEDMRIQPSAEPDEIALAGAIDDVVALSLSASEGAAVQRMADAVETLDLGRLVMVLERAEGNEVAVEADGDAKNGGVLHINGHPLVNTKLTG